MDTPTPVYQMYWKAMQAQTEPEAEAVIAELAELAFKENPLLSYAEARAIQLANIGYFTGYLDSIEDQRRVLALYKTEHPIFGTYEREVTPEKAFAAGIALGAVIRDGNLSLTSEAIAAARKVIAE
jgi:hypothetical protein